MRSDPIGYIDPRRLVHIPRQFQAGHEFSYWLHDRMLSLLKEGEAGHVSSASFKLSDEAEQKSFENLKDEETLDWLLNGKHHQVGKQIVFAQCTLALCADLLSFVSTALKCLEERKTTVAVALLRKPLRETMFMLAWLCADQEDFFEKLKNSPTTHFSKKKLTPEFRKDILARSIDQIAYPSMASATLLYDTVFDKKLENGLAAPFDMASHLVTDATNLMKTEPLNLNYIFKSPADNDHFEFLYRRLSYCLAFIFQIQVVLFERLTNVDSVTVSQDLFIAIGTYDALFSSGKSKIWRPMKKAFGELAHCEFCGAQIEPKKKDLPKFLIMESTGCRKCRREMRFPLTWFFRKGKVDVKEVTKLNTSAK